VKRGRGRTFHVRGHGEHLLPEQFGLGLATAAVVRPAAEVVALANVLGCGTWGRLENVRAAERAGSRGHHFTGTDGLKSVLYH